MVYGVDRLMGTHPYLWAAMGYLGYKSAYDWKVISGVRDNQAALYAQGRDAAGNIIDPNAVVTDAPPGESAHEIGLAIDIAPTIDKGRTVIFDKEHPAYDEKDKLLKELTFVRTGITISSGPDRPHVEVTNWRQHREWKKQWAGFAIALGVVGLIAALR